MEYPGNISKVILPLKEAGYSFTIKASLKSRKRNNISSA
jgi:hypothetical protein